MIRIGILVTMVVSAFLGGGCSKKPAEKKVAESKPEAVARERPAETVKAPSSPTKDALSPAGKAGSDRSSTPNDEYDNLMKQLERAIERNDFPEVRRLTELMSDKGYATRKVVTEEPTSRRVLSEESSRDAIGQIKVTFDYGTHGGNTAFGAKAYDHGERLLAEAKFLRYTTESGHLTGLVVEEAHFDPGSSGEIIYKGEIEFGITGNVKQERNLSGNKRHNFFTTWPI